MTKFLLFSLMISALTLTGCFQAYSDSDDDFNTIPVTNNPNIVPSHGSGLPGMPSAPIR